MARGTLRQRLERLDARRQALAARLSKQQRSEDTRRKILLGALVLHRLTHDRDAFSANLADWLQRELLGFLSRDQDRTLFADLLGDLAHATGSKAAASSEREES